MRNSLSQFQHFLRVALLALPVLLLLGLNGRTVSLLRPASPAQTQVSIAPRATVIKQRVMLEAASPLGSYVAPAEALGWLPFTLPATWLPRRVYQALATAPLGAPVTLRSQLLCQQLLRTALSPQAP
jgi:hypothetical protein